MVEMKPPTVFALLAIVFLLLLGILLWPVLSILIWNLSDSIQTRRRYRAVHQADRNGITPGVSLHSLAEE
jgi:hypothetical protein